MADIARMLGLSLSAVRYALSDDPALQAKLSPATRERVLKTARETGYRVHQFARALRSGKTRLIGVIANVSETPIAAKRSYYAAKAIQKYGYDILACQIWWDVRQVQRSVDLMLDARVEGVLLVNLSGDYTGEVSRFRDAGIPLAATGGGAAAFVPSVTSDYRQGMGLLTRHLIESGCRRPAFVAPWTPDDAKKQESLQQRLDGFVETCARAGLGPSDVRVCHGKTRDGADYMSFGKKWGLKLLREAVPPDALVCSNDETAFGALAACVELGVRVPDDIAVTGFDNHPMGISMVPSLTTVAQPIEAVSTKAVDLLMETIRGGKRTDRPKPIRLPCELVVRQSSARAPAAGDR
ncbi:MAG: LacI family DNA-binding transcriptional regulator [Kiritimatiellae bacterium]|nr:LacI family DNA-binding transcriptional regulator [Kiritimatiellia bacterium]